MTDRRKATTVTLTVKLTVDPDAYERDYYEDATKEVVREWATNLVSDAIAQSPLAYLIESVEVEAR